MAADKARGLVLAEVSAGSLSLDEVFAAVDAEEPASHTIGHIHVRALLIALPRIGEVKADAILDGLGVAHDHHLASLGSSQRAAIVAGAAAA